MSPADDDRHWATLAESTFVGGIWLLSAVHRLLGRAPFRLCLYPVVFWYWLTRPLARRSSRQYLRLLSSRHPLFDGRPARRHSFRHLFRFADTLLDKTLAVSGRYKPVKLEFSGHEPLLDRLRSGTGAVLITAHMGCLELLQFAADRRDGLRITILVHTRHAQNFNRVLARMNPGTKVQFVQVSEFSPATIMMLADRVRAGEFVAIAGDRVPVGGGRVAHADFLGRRAAFPVGPYLMASLLDCPAYFIGCLRSAGGYRVRVDALAERVVLPKRGRDAVFAECAAKFSAWIEEQLKSSPYDWFNFFNFWNQDPHARQNG